MDEYKKWVEICESLKEKEINFYFKEREVWWCYIGENIGREQNGKEEFKRPVLIFKKINKDLFWGIPFTTKYKNEYYKFPVGIVSGELNYALWEQLRVFSSKRLLDYYTSLDKKFFEQLKFILKGFI